MTVQSSSSRITSNELSGPSSEATHTDANELAAKASPPTSPLIFQDTVSLVRRPALVKFNRIKSYSHKKLPVGAGTCLAGQVRPKQLSFPYPSARCTQR